jgi:hypothetical protein
MTEAKPAELTRARVRNAWRAQSRINTESRINAVPRSQRHGEIARDALPDAEPEWQAAIRERKRRQWLI